jgi:hypothetical protein
MADPKAAADRVGQPSPRRAAWLARIVVGHRASKARGGVTADGTSGDVVLLGWWRLQQWE